MYSNRPKNTNFRQQNISARYPVFVARGASPIFCCVGVVLMSFSVFLRSHGLGIKDFSLDYTDCYTDAGDNCADVLKRPASANNSGGYLSCRCDVKFEIKEDFYGDVYVYYGLTNFYQNHRAYVRSRDDRQLAGFAVPTNELDSDCSPYRLGGNGSTATCPCGSVANSVFNDTLRLYVALSQRTYERVPIDQDNIAWSTDRSVKFKNPPGQSLRDAFADTVRPINWPHDLYNYSDAAGNRGLENQNLIVWMRIAAFPDFLKPYGRIRRIRGQNVTISAGNYKLSVDYNFPVKNFDGTKRFFISNTSLLGGKNPSLWMMFTLVGMLGMTAMMGCILLHLITGTSFLTLLKIYELENDSIIT